MTFAPQREESIGTIDSIISRSIIRRVYNDGDRTYLTLQQEPRNSLPITQQSTAIIIPMTNPNIDFVQFDKSFISLVIGMYFRLGGYDQKNEKDNNVGQKYTDGQNEKDAAPIPLNMPDVLRMFVGLKNSSDCIGEYAIYHKGKQVSGTLQSNATTESFLYHNFRSESDKMFRPSEHSIADRVWKYDLDSSCGYFPKLSDIQNAVQNDNGVILIPFIINIPFNDILPFQQFRSYPSSLFGDLEFRFKFNPRAFVTLQCDPESCISKYVFNTKDKDLDGLARTFSMNSVQYDNDYVQLGDSFQGIKHVKINVANTGSTIFPARMKYLDADVGKVSWNFEKVAIAEVHSILTGYKAHPRALEQMRAKFMSHPWVKFSQNINYLPFSTRPSRSGLNMVQQSYLNNTTDLLLLFPRTENQAQGTVFHNPHLKDLTITTMNRRYPEVPIRTTSYEYLSQMMTSADTFGKKPTAEFINSYVEPEWQDDGKYHCETDRSSFVGAIKVERPSAMGLICDGLDSKGFQIPIRLMASPTYSVDNRPKDTATGNPDLTKPTYDQYCSNAEKNPPPVLVTVNDAYWIFNAKDGGQCIYSNRPFNETVDLFMAQ